MLRGERLTRMNDNRRHLETRPDLLATGDSAFMDSGHDFARLMLWTAGGLGVGLLFATVQQFLRGLKPRGNPLSFLTFVLLEGSFWIYLGLVGGLATGLVYGTITNPDLPKDIVIQNNGTKDWKLFSY